MYTMIRDQCSNGVAVSPPQFEVVGDFIPDDRKAVSRFERAIIRLNDERNTVSRGLQFLNLYDVVLNFLSFTYLWYLLLHGIDSTCVNDYLLHQQRASLKKSCYLCV